MAAARTLVGVLSSHSAKRGKFGFGKTLTLVVLIMAVHPAVVDASGDGGGAAVTVIASSGVPRFVWWGLP